MKIRNIFAISALTVASVAAAQQINPITKAVLDGYEMSLRENPKDYETLYQRAAQYYSLSMYDNALTDIVKAIDCTPAKDKESLKREYSLMADIEIELKEYAKALIAVEKALEYAPDSYPDLYRKGNILLHLKDGEAAYRTFSGMQRLKSRSQEAYFGMAKACLLVGKNTEAESLMKEAQNADPTSAITFCRIGDLYREMGDNQQAAANYLSAFALNSDSDRPLQSLISLGNVDFQSVADAVDYALTRSENRIPLYFIKGNIANFTGNYQQAYDAMQGLLKIPAGQEASVYASLAKSCVALDKLEEAAENIDKALAKSNTVENLILKSEIERASGRPSAALISAGKALQGDQSNPDAMIAVALANVDLKDYQKALSNLNEAVITDAADPYPLMLRAWVNSECLGNSKPAVADRNRVASMPADKFPEIAYKALAKALNGKKIDADEIMEKALSGQPDKNDCYFAAMYYAQTGNLEKARQWKERAVNAGYSDLHKLNSDRTANLNLSPLSHL